MIVNLIFFIFSASLVSEHSNVSEWIFVPCGSTDTGRHVYLRHRWINNRLINSVDINVQLLAVFIHGAAILDLRLSVSEFKPWRIVSGSDSNLRILEFFHSSCTLQYISLFLVSFQSTTFVSPLELWCFCSRLSSFLTSSPSAPQLGIRISLSHEKEPLGTGESVASPPRQRFSSFLGA